MDPVAILSLISDLYAQVHQATARAERAEAELAQLSSPPNTTD